MDAEQKVARESEREEFRHIRAYVVLEEEQGRAAIANVPNGLFGQYWDSDLRSAIC